MLKRNELLLPDSCLNKAAENEPLFIIRAKDPLAPATLRHWAAMAKGHHESEKIAGALELATIMDEWRRENTEVGPTGKTTVRSPAQAAPPE